MIDAYKQGKDLYATIASRVYHNNYEDNLEFNPKTGKRSEAGAKRRSSVKGLLLGIMYGMTVQGIAQRLECDQKEAQSIIDGFYNGFPKVRKWTDDTMSSARKTGYVEDWYGRRRRLPDLLLPEYSIKYMNDSASTFNPIIGCSYRSIDPKVESALLEKLHKAKDRRSVVNVINDAKEDGISIHSNSNLISRSERQCVNARIQGGAATMTKVAMIKIHNDEELNRLGFRMLIGVHDELIGECPKENADEVAKRLSYVMSTCIAEHCVVPFKCDADVSERWYYNVYCNELQTDKKAFMGKGMTEEQAIDKICEEHIESTREFIMQCLNN